MLSANPKRQADRARAVAERRIAEKAARRASLIATPGRMASMGPASTTAAPKDVPARNATLLEMASGRPCLLIAVPECRNRIEDASTTVACHQNEGKGTGTRRPDHYSAWGCGPCHRWYDQSGAPREQKRALFLPAHIRQVDHWRHIATSPAEPERFRRAAQWALAQLNATPAIDLETAP